MPRPEMLIDAILKLHEQIQRTKLGARRELAEAETEAAALTAPTPHEMKGSLR